MVFFSRQIWMKVLTPAKCPNSLIDWQGCGIKSSPPKITWTVNLNLKQPPHWIWKTDGNRKVQFQHVVLWMLITVMYSGSEMWFIPFRRICMLSQSLYLIIRSLSVLIYLGQPPKNRSFRKRGAELAYYFFIIIIQATLLIRRGLWFADLLIYTQRNA